MSITKSDRIEALVRSGATLAQAVEAATKEHGHDAPRPTTAAKARGAGVGGGLGAALAAIAVWIGEQYGLDMGPVEIPLSIVLSAVLGYVGAYFPQNRPLA